LIFASFSIILLTVLKHLDLQQINYLNMKDFEIIGIDIRPLKVPLYDDFTISRGSVSETDNILVKIKLKNGIAGYGEVAPVKYITGEDIFSSRKVLLQLGALLKGHNAMNFRALSDVMMGKAPENPSARAGLEMAMLDAVCRTCEVPMWSFLGGRQPEGHFTDMTIPILPMDRSLALAAQWHSRGFRTLKIKFLCCPIFH